MTQTTVLRTFLAIIFGLGFAGYGLRWHWVGISGRTATLWDWLSLLLMPLAFAALPLADRLSQCLREQTCRAIAGTGVSVAGFVAVAYLAPLSWTGFPHSTLWDWLHLLLPPAAIASVPFLTRVRLARRHAWYAVIGLASFGFIVVGGYAWRWRWTGLQDSTAWDWLHLVLLPAAVPTLLRPALVAAMTQPERF